MLRFLVRWPLSLIVVVSLVACPLYDARHPAALRFIIGTLCAPYYVFGTIIAGLLRTPWPWNGAVLLGVALLCDAALRWTISRLRHR